MCASAQIIPHILPIITRPLTTVRIKHITNEYTEAISTLYTYCMNTVYHYCAHCNPQYSTVRNVPISIRILLPMKHSILHCAKYTISIHVLRTLHASELHCKQCTHQHQNIAHTVPINTPLCAMYPSVSKYCAHCNPQYCSVRTVPISRQILSPLHASELHCAKCTHKNQNIANTAPLSTPLCAMFPSASPYCAHCTDQDNFPVAHSSSSYPRMDSQWIKHKI